MLYQVLRVTRYSFTDQQSSRLVTGTKVVVADASSPRTDDAKGVALLSLNGDYSLYDSFSEVPASYDLQTTLTPGSGGTVKVKVLGATKK